MAHDIQIRAGQPALWYVAATHDGVGYVAEELTGLITPPHDPNATADERNRAIIGALLRHALRRLRLPEYMRSPRPGTPTTGGIK